MNTEKNQFEDELKHSIDINKSLSSIIDIQRVQIEINNGIISRQKSAYKILTDEFERLEDSLGKMSEENLSLKRIVSVSQVAYEALRTELQASKDQASEYEIAAEKIIARISTVENNAAEIAKELDKIKENETIKGVSKRLEEVRQKLLKVGSGVRATDIRIAVEGLMLVDKIIADIEIQGRI